MGYDHKCTYIGLHVKYPLFFSEINETLNLTYFQKYSHISNFMNAHSVGAEFFHAHRRTDGHT